MGLHEGEPYIALEYVDGKDLRKVAARMRDRSCRCRGFVLYVMRRVLDALAYAHRKRDDDEREIGLVHRDISPQNILISYEGEVKVIDFGLAKSTLNAAETNPSIILGKFLYMSPEQARHREVDRRSDLYSVGLCLYELLSGATRSTTARRRADLAVTQPHITPLEPLCRGWARSVRGGDEGARGRPGPALPDGGGAARSALACLLDIDPAGPRERQPLHARGVRHRVPPGAADARVVPGGGAHAGSLSPW